MLTRINPDMMLIQPFTQGLWRQNSSAMFLPTIRTCLKLVYVLILLCIIGLAVIGIAIWNFDLDKYTQELSARMSEALHQQVSIGSGKLSFRDGIAVELQQLAIGSDQEVRVRIPKISATLEIIPLLHGQFQLKEVRLIEPQVELKLAANASHPQAATSNLMETLGIDVISVYNASLHIAKEGVPAPWNDLQFSGVNAVLRNWQTGRQGSLALVGSLPEFHAGLALETTLPSTAEAPHWSEEPFRGRLKFSIDNPANPPELASQVKLPKAYSLDLSFNGTPSAGIPISLSLAAASSDAPLASVKGLWTYRAGAHDFSDLSGQIFNIPLRGEVHFSADAASASRSLYGNLAVTPFDISTPAIRYWQLPVISKLATGKVNQLQLNFAQSWDSKKPAAELPIFNLALNLENLAWGDSKLQTIPNLTAELLFQKDQVEVRKSHIILPTGDPLQVEGRIESVFKQPRLDLRATGELSLHPLQQLVQSPDKLHLSGTTPFMASLYGELSDLNLGLSADFATNGIGFADVFKKTPQQKALLSLKGSLSNNMVTVEQLELELDNQLIAARLSGDLAYGLPSFNVSLAPLDLKKLARYSPFLDQRDFSGVLSAELKQQDNSPELTLHINNGAAYLTHALGPLNSIFGNVTLNRKRMSFKQLRASLGKSAFSIDGGIDDWQKPRLRLDLSSPRVRAHDLFFSDQTLILYDVNGRLLIDGNGIEYAPVRLRVENDTLVTVTGRLKSFEAPQVLLDVQAETANVLNVIKLFTGPAHKGDGTGKAPYVRITTNIKTGTLGDLRFKNAEATIQFNQGMLDIHPLNFHNGMGTCSGRVVFNGKEEAYPLKVSGHIKGIDAQVIYRDFFKKDGLINGDLQADFYIEGKPDEQFWASARGGIGLQVRDGVLNKFNSLAKVFSLLNVSQLFALKLPDLQTEGMPFSLMEGSLKIADGYLATEDLKITSEAMNLSLVGRQGLLDDSLDFVLGVMPLRTVDKIVTSIPLAGWVLAGDDKALLTAQFKLEGTGAEPKVTAIPLASLSEGVLGIFKRTFGLPGKLAKDIGSALSREEKESGEDSK